MPRGGGILSQRGNCPGRISPDQRMEPNGKRERPFPSADGEGRGYEPEERMDQVESDGSRIRIQDSPESPMARIAILFPQRFEEPEYRKPAEAFHRAGHELVHLGGGHGVVNCNPTVTRLGDITQDIARGPG